MPRKDDRARFARADASILNINVIEPEHNCPCRPLHRDLLGQTCIVEFWERVNRPRNSVQIQSSSLG